MGKARPDPGTYTCASCGGVYTKTVSDEECLAEFQINFPGESVEDAELICDDCYQELINGDQALN